MAKPKLALIPAAQGSKFYSVLPSSGVGDFTFSRSGSATRINSQGLIETVGNGVSRLNYPLLDGKVVGCPSHILEPQRTNLLPYSEDFSNSAWGKANVTLTSNNTISPDGTLNASKLVATGADGNLQDSISVTSGTTYTFSVYLKTVSGTLDIAISLGSPGFPQNEGDGGRYKNITVTNEWKRYTITSTADASATSGIGVGGFGSFSTGEQVYIWGAQLEVGSYPTSYIPTNGSAVTRSAETSTGSGDADTFNDSEGVLFADIAANSKGGGYKLISLTDSTSGNSFISIGMMVNTTESYKQIRFSGVNLFSDYTDPINQTDFNKIAIKYKSGNSSFYVNGFEIDSSSVTYTPNAALSELKFSYFQDGDKFYGNTKQIQYYDSALTNSELETLTSWVSFSDMANGQLYTIE